MVRKNGFITSTDLSDAYYSVPVAVSDQKYLIFQSEGKLQVCLFTQWPHTSTQAFHKNIEASICSSAQRT